jgi:hypothetical protein
MHLILSKRMKIAYLKQQKKDLLNALTIGIFSQDYINAESESKCDKNIDEEWLNRFIDEAKYVSDEKLQQLFARLLKEKIYNPDAVNKRVINIIKNIDASELETIQTYMTYFVEGALSSAIVSKMPSSIDGLTNLSNIGLMNFIAAPVQSQVEIHIDITPTMNEINVKGYDFIFNGVKSEFCITFDSPYILTKEGRAVYDIITVPMPTDVCEVYKQVFKSQCNGKCIMEIKKTF